MPSTSAILSTDSGETISVETLAQANSIDLSENGIYDELGIAARMIPLLVKKAPVAFLKTIHALQAERTVWGMCISSENKKVVDFWRKAFRARRRLASADVLILDSSRIKSNTVAIDGHHRIIAAIRENKALRYVDLADLP
jgi:hypothetical protein